MIGDKEQEYKKLFLFLKRWAHHWQTYSAHRAHSSTQYLIEPAQKTLNYILSVDAKGKTYKEKLEWLDCFYQEQDRIEQESPYMHNSFYLECWKYNQRCYEKIENGEILTHRKLSNYH